MCVGSYGGAKMSIFKCLSTEAKLLWHYICTWPHFTKATRVIADGSWGLPGLFHKASKASITLSNSFYWKHKHCYFSCDLIDWLVHHVYSMRTNYLRISHQSCPPVNTWVFNIPSFPCPNPKFCHKVILPIQFKYEITVSLVMLPNHWRLWPLLNKLIYNLSMKSGDNIIHLPFCLSFSWSSIYTASVLAMVVTMSLWRNFISTVPSASSTPPLH